MDPARGPRGDRQSESAARGLDRVGGSPEVGRAWEAHRKLPEVLAQPPAETALL